MKRAVLAAGVLATVAGCQKGQGFTQPEPGWERMLEQPRLDPYEPSSFFADGRGMRAPPPGTIPTSHTSDPRLRAGLEADGGYVQSFPVALTRARLERGRRQFEIVCATCHGIDGGGKSAVAARMTVRKPPSLHEERIRDYPVGRIFDIATRGYGMMPSFGAHISIDDRWSIVAYVRALQRSRHADVTQLPEGVQAAMAGDLP